MSYPSLTAGGSIHDEDYPFQVVMHVLTIISSQDYTG